jgi:branched-chain amino acid transport system permease protein
MAISCTLAVSITNVPNFAVATFGTIGIYISFTCINLFGIGLYPSLFFCFIGGGAIGVIIYYLLVKPLRRRGATREELMIATLGLDIFLIALLNIYADYLTRTFKIRTREFTLSMYDFNIGGLHGVFIVSTLVFIAVLIALHLIFTRTNMGIAMKALGEDPSLAECEGVNTERLCMITWFLVGALPATAGAFYPIYWISNPTVSLFIVVSVFASCVLGGFATIYDATAGGYIIGLAQTLLVSYLAKIIGSWILPYGFFVALLIMIATVFLFPQGLYGLPWDEIIKKIQNIFVSIKVRWRLK